MESLKISDKDYTLTITFTQSKNNPNRAVFETKANIRHDAVKRALEKIKGIRRAFRSSLVRPLSLIIVLKEDTVEWADLRSDIHEWITICEVT